MKLELETERLSLSPLTVDDADLAVALWTDHRVAHYNGGVVPEATIRAEMPLTTRRGADGAIGIWCISERASGDKIGSTYLLPLPTEKDDVDYAALRSESLPDGDIELGYFLKPEAWGKGYATEIGRQMLSFAFAAAKLNELVAAVNADNTASIHVLDKIGFRFDRNTVCWGSTYPLYRLSRIDWLSSEQP